MWNSSYPRPRVALQVPSVHPWALREILPPPPSHDVELALSLPSTLAKLLEDRRPVRFTDAYVRTTHAIQAVLSRVLSKGDYPPRVPGEDRKAWVKRTARMVLEKKLACEKGEQVDGVAVNDVEPRLFNVLDRYVLCDDERRRRSGKAATLLLTHATGFPRRVSSHRLAPKLGFGLMTDMWVTALLSSRYGSQPWSVSSGQPIRASLSRRSGPSRRSTTAIALKSTR